MFVARRRRSGSPFFSQRICFAAGDHEYWDWRPRERTAQRLCRRDRAYFVGCGITRMTVVPMTRAQARQHAEFSRCRAGNCPGLTPPAP